MTLIIDIEDDKVPFFLELLDNLKFVATVDQISPYKANLVSSLCQAVKEINEVSSGRLKARDADEFLNEL